MAPIYTPNIDANFYVTKMRSLSTYRTILLHTTHPLNVAQNGFLYKKKIIMHFCITLALINNHRTVPPKITPFSFARDVNVGDRTSIQCVVGTGDLPLIFVWLKDDQQIIQSIGSGIDNVNHKNDIGLVGTLLDGSDGDSAITIRQYDDFTSSLSITSVTRSQGGNYTCKVQNDAAMVWHSAILRVNGKLFDVTHAPSFYSM